MQEAIRRTSLKLELLELKEALEAEATLLEDEVRKLRIIAHNEQADVENLQSPGIRGLFLNLTGKMQERLEQEQTEARHAQQDYQAAAAKLDSVLSKLAQYTEELASLGNCEDELGQMLALPEDAALETLRQCTAALSEIQSKSEHLMAALAKVSQLGAIRDGTRIPVALANTDDQLRSAEYSTQELLKQLQAELRSFKSNLAPFGIDLDVEEFLKISDDHLIGLYSYAMITSRVEHVTVLLRHIGFRLDALKPELARLTLQREKEYLQTLLDAARSQ